MRQVGEALFFVALALALHLLALGRQSPPGGAQSAGEGGEALVSLAPAPPRLAALVTSWDTPPKAATQAPAQTGPAAPLTDPLAPISAVDPLAGSAAPDRPDPALPDTAPDLGTIALPARPPVPDAPERMAPKAPVEAPLPDPVTPAPPPARATAQQPDQPVPDTPPPAPVPPAPAVPSQKAAGSGGGAQAGQAAPSASATRDGARVTSLKAAWGASIRARVERRKTYPRAARGASGRAIVLIEIDSGGHLLALSLAQSAGHPALDDAALKAVRAVRRFPPAPDGLAPGRYSFRLPLDFSG